VWYKRILWFHFTRLLGVVLLAYGMLYDQTTDRGTLILVGAGLLGIDKVVRA
jgi:hypothetical protein